MVTVVRTTATQIWIPCRLKCLSTHSFFDRCFSSVSETYPQCKPHGWPCVRDGRCYIVHGNDRNNDLHDSQAVMSTPARFSTSLFLDGFPALGNTESNVRGAPIWPPLNTLCCCPHTRRAASVSAQMMDWPVTFVICTSSAVCIGKSYQKLFRQKVF